jgi:hypothetical protein
MRGSRQGSAGEERCHYRFQAHVSKKEAPGCPGALLPDSYCALPVPLLEPLVAVSLEGAVRGEVSPGPAVVPVLPRAAGAVVAPAGAAGAAVDPPLAAPERWYAFHSSREIMPSPFLSMAEKSALPRLARLDVVLPVLGLRSAVGALGSPADPALGAPPVARGEVPMPLAPEGGAPASPPEEELWARMTLSPAADTGAAKGTAKAAATASGSNFLRFISNLLNE